MMLLFIRERGADVATNNVDFQEYYTRYLESLTSKVKVAVKQALRYTWADFFAVVDEKIHSMFDEVVQGFYSDYTPGFYDRNESLYEILQTELSEDSLSIQFDPSKMTPFRNGYDGEDGLYDQVFRRGWHGGAASGEGHPSPGTPYWRTPVPYYNRWGHEAAFASLSPLDELKRRVTDYENYEMQADFNRIWSVYASNIKIDS